MATILQPTFSNLFSYKYESHRIFILFSLKFVPSGPINNKPALVRTVSWQQDIICTSDGIVYLHVSLGLVQLTEMT